MAVEKVKTVHERVNDFRAICHKMDADMEKPEIVYKFSNGVEKKSTDRTESGVYRRP